MGVLIRFQHAPGPKARQPVATHQGGRLACVHGGAPSLFGAAPPGGLRWPASSRASVDFARPLTPVTATKRCSGTRAVTMLQVVQVRAVNGEPSRCCFTLVAACTLVFWCFEGAFLSESGSGKR